MEHLGEVAKDVEVVVDEAEAVVTAMLGKIAAAVVAARSET